jgi:catalase
MNPFVTWVWPHADYPLIDVGVLELNQNPIIFSGYWASGIRARTYRGRDWLFADKMLQARILSYLMHNAIVWGRITNRFRWIDALLQPTITSVTGKCARTEMEGKRTTSRIVLTRCKLTRRIKNPFWGQQPFADWYDRNCEGKTIISGKSI